MKNFRIQSVVLFTFLAGTFFCSVDLIAAPRAVLLAKVKGEVLVEGKPARPGQGVQPTSVVITKKGSCTILMGKNSVVNLGEESELKITKFFEDQSSEDAEVDLKYGQTRALVRPTDGNQRRFKVRTKSATMGVRGTHIFVNAPKDESSPATFATLEGKASLQLPVVSSSGAPQGTQTVEISENQSFEAVPAVAAAATGGDSSQPNADGGPGDSAPPSPGENGSVAPQSTPKEMDSSTAEGFAQAAVPPPTAIMSKQEMAFVRQNQGQDYDLGAFRDQQGAPGFIPNNRDFKKFVPLDPTLDAPTAVPVKVNVGVNIVAP